MPEHPENEEVVQKTRSEADHSIDRIREELKILRDHLDRITGGKKAAEPRDRPPADAV